VPQHVYELSDLQDRPIEGQFYNYEVAKVTVSPQTDFEIDKIVCTRTRAVLNNVLSSGEDMTRHTNFG